VQIEYIEYNKKDLDLIRPLWQRLKEHHEIQSHHFPEHYARLTFNLRKKDLLKKSKYGALRLDLAKDSDTGEHIGYCISTISKDKQGEIDSIYVEPNYRKVGIGDNLMKRALYMNIMSKKVGKLNMLKMGAKMLLKLPV